MFDTHCHLNFKRFKKNLQEVVLRAKEQGVEFIVVPGTDIKTSAKSLEISKDNKGIYSAVGIHPHHVYKYLKIGEREKLSLNDLKKLADSDLETIESMLPDTKVVAVGEIGLDCHVYKETVYEEYSITPEFLSLQKYILKKQINLALNHKKSIVLHNREAKERLLSILKDVFTDDMKNKVVFHCCEADPDLLKFAKDHDIFIGVDGDLTYDKSKQDFIKLVPLEKLVIETDSPYILPEPLLSEKKYPNEPANVKYVAEFVAKIKSQSLKEIVDQTTKNGKKLFGLI